jgi:hypothetical protein
VHSGVLVISVSFPGILAFSMCVCAWLEVEAREIEAWEMDFEMLGRRGSVSIPLSEVSIPIGYEGASFDPEGLVSIPL